MFFSINATAATLTFDLTVRKINFNNEKKLYDISFNEMAAVYLADAKFLKCLQKSLDTKKAAKITYLGRELKLTECSI